MGRCELSIVETLCLSYNKLLFIVNFNFLCLADQNHVDLLVRGRYGQDSVCCMGCVAFSIVKLNALLRTILTRP